MTMQHHVTGKPFLYVASKDAGLKIYSISSAPVQVKTPPSSAPSMAAYRNMGRLYL